MYKITLALSERRCISTTFWGHANGEGQGLDQIKSEGSIGKVLARHTCAYYQIDTGPLCLLSGMLTKKPRSATEDLDRTFNKCSDHLHCRGRIHAAFWVLNCRSGLDLGSSNTEEHYTALIRTFTLDPGVYKYQLACAHASRHEMTR